PVVRPAGWRCCRRRGGCRRQHHEAGSFGEPSLYALFGFPDLGSPSSTTVSAVEGVAAERLGHEDEAQGTESCKEISTRSWERISSAVSRSLRASVRSRFQRVPKTVASVPVSPIRATHISVGSMDWPCLH